MWRNARGVDRQHAPAAQRLRNGARSDPARQSFHERGLANAFLTDEKSIPLVFTSPQSRVVVATGKDLDEAVKVAIATDQAIEQAFFGRVREVARKVLQQIKLRLIKPRLPCLRRRRAWRRSGRPHG